MKIALVNKAFSLSHGGLERYAVNLSMALTAEGHEVHALGQSFEELPDQITIHRLATRRHPAWLQTISFSQAVKKVLAAEQFDLVYGLTRCDAVDIYRLGDGIQRHWLALRYPFKPWRWLACIINPVHLVNLVYEQRLLGKGGCKYLVTNSQLCKQQAQQYYRIPSERIVVVYNGVDQEVFSPATVAVHRNSVRHELGLPENAIVIVYVSNNWRRKGLAVLLEAVAMLGGQGRNLHVVVVGRGRSAPFVRFSKRLGIAGRVYFVGATRVVERYYAAGELFVLPTVYDPFANVCLEAMACGLPVITTSGNGAAEILTPGVSGYIQNDPFDASELSALLGKCLDPAVLRRMGEAARAAALPFTRERNMQQALGVFRQFRE